MSDKAINQWRGAQSRAAGLDFETNIAIACEYYKKNRLACIDKTPEPIRQIGSMDKRGQFRGCYIKDAQPDFKGTLAGGQAVAFEAKSTASDRLMIDRVTPGQTDALQLHNDLGAAVFVLTLVQNRVWRIDWGKWVMQAQVGKHKYFNADDLGKMATEIFVRRGVMGFLEGIGEIG